MPHPLPSDDEVRDLLGPKERLLFDALQEQMRLTRGLLQAYYRAMILSMIATAGLAISLGLFAVGMILRH